MYVMYMVHDYSAPPGWAHRAPFGAEGLQNAGVCTFYTKFYSVYPCTTSIDAWTIGYWVCGLWSVVTVYPKGTQSANCRHPWHAVDSKWQYLGSPPSPKTVG